MKRLMALLLLLLSSISMRSATVVSFELTNFVAAPATNRTVKITPQEIWTNSANVYDIFITNTASGVFSTPIIDGKYMVDILGPPTATRFWIAVTNAGPAVDSKQIMIAVPQSVYPPGVYSWSITASDARYAPIGASFGGNAVAPSNNIVIFTTMGTNYISATLDPAALTNHDTRVINLSNTVSATSIIGAHIGDGSGLTNLTFGAVTNALGYFPLTNSYTAITNTLSYNPLTNTFAAVTNALGYLPATNALVSPGTYLTNGDTRALNFKSSLDVSNQVTAWGTVQLRGPAISTSTLLEADGSQNITSVLAGSNIVFSSGTINATVRATDVTNALGYIPATNGVVLPVALTNQDTRNIQFAGQLSVTNQTTLNGTVQILTPTVISPSAVLGTDGGKNLVSYQSGSNIVVAGGFINATVRATDVTNALGYIPATNNAFTTLAITNFQSTPVTLANTLEVSNTVHLDGIITGVNPITLISDSNFVSTSVQTGILVAPHVVSVNGASKLFAVASDTTNMLFYVDPYGRVTMMNSPLQAGNPLKLQITGALGPSEIGMQAWGTNTSDVLLNDTYFRLVSTVPIPMRLGANNADDLVLTTTGMVTVLPFNGLQAYGNTTVSNLTATNNLTVSNNFEVDGFITSEPTVFNGAAFTSGSPQTNVLISTHVTSVNASSKLFDIAPDQTNQIFWVDPFGDVNVKGSPNVPSNQLVQVVVANPNGPSGMSVSANGGSANSAEFLVTTQSTTIGNLLNAPLALLQNNVNAEILASTGAVFNVPLVAPTVRGGMSITNSLQLASLATPYTAIGIDANNNIINYSAGTGMAVTNGLISWVATQQQITNALNFIPATNSDLQAFKGGAVLTNDTRALTLGGTVWLTNQLQLLNAAPSALRLRDSSFASVILGTDSGGDLVPYNPSFGMKISGGNIINTGVVTFAISSPHSGLIASVSPTVGTSNVTLTLDSPGFVLTNGLSAASTISNMMSFYGTVQILTPTVVSASQVLGTDGGKNVVSYAPGNNISMAGGVLAVNDGESYPTNTGAITPDFSHAVTWFQTNNNFTFGQPINVTPNRDETVIFFVTNSTALDKVITAPQGIAATNGVNHVTNVTSCTFHHYGNYFTNLTFAPIY